MAELDSDGDELFSMDELEKDLKKGRGARRAPWFLAGLVLGIAGTVAVPRLLAPYLPDVFGGGEILSGPVLEEVREGDRLLLTIMTEPGALIASFTERVSEIAMLVAPGDTVTIAVDDYDPFVENPDFEGVRKGSGPPGGEPGPNAGEGVGREGTGPPSSPGQARGGAGAAEDTSSAGSAGGAAPGDSTGAPPARDTTPSGT